MIHEFWPSLLAILGLAGILTPLLILFSLKHGVIASMSNRLLASPKYREIKSEKHQKLKAKWFTEMAKDSKVEFIIPHIFFLNTNAQLTNDFASEHIFVDLNPTAPGDPILKRWHLTVNKNDEVVLSFYAAEKLNLLDKKKMELLPEVLTGDTRIQALIRNIDQIEEHSLRVVGIIPKIDSSKNNNIMYVSLPLLTALDDFKNQELLKRDIKDRFYPQFRLYAKKLKDVQKLVYLLESHDIPVTSKVDRIQEMQQIDTLLVLVFVVVSGISALGFLLANTVNLLANVSRKQRDLSILRLLGYSSHAIAVFPAIQAIIIAVAGSILAWGLYYLAAPLIEAQFNDNIRSLFGYRLASENGTDLMLLFPTHFFTAMGLTVLVSLFASIAAGIHAANLMPAKGIRHD